MKNKKELKRMNKIPGYISVRDPLMVALINGATKAGVFTDLKKAKSKKACRGKFKEEL